MTFRYGYTVEGTTVTLHWRHQLPNKTYAHFDSAWVRVLDTDDQRIAGFETDAVATVDPDDDTLVTYTFRWGTDAGQLPAITETLDRHVVWGGVDTDGEDVVSDFALWEHRHQRGQ